MDTPKRDRAEYQRKWREQNKAKVVAYRAVNRGKNAERMRKWRAENPEAARAYYKAYREKNREKIGEHERAKWAEKYERNKDYYREKGKGYNESGAAKEWREKHKDKLAEYDRQRHPERYQRNKAGIDAKNRRNELLRKYGLTVPTYEKLVKASGGLCRLCGKAPGKRGVCVDHNHQTGLVRGMLCHKCNVALGLANDDPELLRRMADYLETGGGFIPIK